MVGFLGNQFLLSGTLDAEEHSTITLKSGIVITGYFSNNGGPIQFYSFDPKTKAVTFLSSFGSLSTNISDPYLMAADDGGFRVVYNTQYNLATKTGSLLYRQYDANGVLDGPEQTLTSGWIEGTRTYDTKNGFFTTYRNRTSEPDEPEYVGAFYNDAGQLIRTFDFGAGKNPSGFAHPEPQATLLSNGNLAVVWQKSNLDGSFLQIFKPNGTKAGAEKALGNIPLTFHPDVVETHPDGGFIVAHVSIIYEPGSPQYMGPIIIQRYSNTGTKLGPEISFDTTGDLGGRIIPGSHFDVAFTKEGLIAIAWTGTGVTPSDGTDVYYAILTASGKLVVGPEVADQTLGDDQLDVQFNTLKNGNLLLTFKDDATVQFSHVASIQGRLIVEPDYIWEGTGGNDTKAGTIGNDVMLGLGGNDTLSGGKGEDLMRGGGGNDKLSGGNRLDVLYGDSGDDLLLGGKGDDFLFGGKGKDTLKGGDGNDDMRGQDGADIIRGGKGDDLAYGGEGNDQLFGDAGNDRMFGDAGNDKLTGGIGNDTLLGGDGNDIVNGNGGNDNVQGDSGDDLLLGGNGDDILRGGDGDDILRGGKHADNLYGNDGNDKLFGNAGNDTFHDEKGNDLLYGGAGADRFLFISADFDQDRIKDFQVGVDVLDMGFLARALDFNGESIAVTDVTDGVKFAVDADNWVIIENLTLSQLTEGVDYIIESPF